MRESTHDWSTPVDHYHLRSIRSDPARYAPGGALHLLYEVVAYPADEASVLGGGRCLVAVWEDGFRVTDYGRGTATVLDETGRPVRKPVMSTEDLRFFGSSQPSRLPDGHERRGMSVVAALSGRLVHTNRRVEGAWTQEYRFGVPEDDLRELQAAGCSGTTVEVRVGPELTPLPPRGRWWSAMTAHWPQLDFEFDGD